MLTKLYSEIYEGYIAAVPLKPNLTPTWFNIAQIAELREFLLTAARSQNVYHNLNVVRKAPAQGRGKYNDFCASPGMVIDFDIKQDSGTAHAANDSLPGSWEEILTLLDEEGLPRPTEVMLTGHGCHGYFLFEEPKFFNDGPSRDRAQLERKKVEQAFAAAFKKRGWKLDAVSDLARIVRAAGTFNHKSFPPKPVSLLPGYVGPGKISQEQIDAVIGRGIQLPARQRGSHLATGAFKAKTSSVDTGLGEGKAIVAGCRWLQGVGRRSDYLTYPEWMAFAGTAKHIQNGEELFHQTSQRDPRYDVVEASSLFEKMIGPMTCEWIRATLAPTECDSCPFPYTSMQTPVALGGLQADLAALMASHVYVTKRAQFFDIVSKEAHIQKYMNEKYASRIGGGVSTKMLAEEYTMQTDHAWYDPGVTSFITTREGKTTFNSWRKSDLVAIAGDASIVLDHFSFLIPDKAEREHVLNVLAHSVQFPSTKINHVIFVIGGQGTGKSWLSMLIREIFGAHNICVVDNSLLNSDFNAAMGDRQVLVLEEVGLEDKVEAYNSLKRWVTDEMMLVNEKGIVRYQASTPKLMLAFSNKEVPLKIEHDDRRFFFVSSPVKPNPPEYYASLFQHGLKQAPAFLAYLLDRNLVGFSAEAPPPMTDVKARVIESSQPVTQQELRSMVEAGEWPFCNEVFQFDNVMQEVLERVGSKGDRSRSAVTKALQALDFAPISVGQVRIGGQQRIRLWAQKESSWMAASAEQLRDQWNKQTQI